MLELHIDGIDSTLRCVCKRVCVCDLGFNEQPGGECRFHLVLLITTLMPLRGSVSSAKGQLSFS